MDLFGPATRAWFTANFAAPTRVQAEGWPRIAEGRHAMLVAPTGSGKTLAAFLWCIDRLIVQPPAADPGVRVLYVSPLKALVYDVERNLRAPLVGIAHAAANAGLSVRIPRVGVRTGDTSAAERRALAREPGEILVTTPESLYLMLGSQVATILDTVDTIIVDEVHALASTKRGAHLMVSLERLVHRTGRDPQRIGLSATARPLADVARFLAGPRPVEVVDTSEPPNLNLHVVVPVPDMTRPAMGRVPDDDAAREGQGIDDLAEVITLDPAKRSVLGAGKRADEATRRASSERWSAQRGSAPARPQRSSGGGAMAPAPAGESLEHSIWPAVYPRLLDLIAAHTTTIVFVNSRGLCERLAQRLNEIAGEDLVRAHHGSISHAQRREIEEMLKAGHIRAIVATSSLELGIDIGTADLVVLVESPGAVSRGLQRVGRAGHGVGQTSVGRIFPKHRGDLLEATVVARRMREGAIEPLAVPKNPLDVLAQHIVAMCGERVWKVEDLAAVVRRAANFTELPDAALHGVIDMLAGRYPSNAFADLRPRLDWDREADTLTARRGAKMISIVSGGTIPDRGTYAMTLGEGGPRVGELDEEMVNETLPGQNIMLGATTWRVERITRDRVIVAPAPGEPGRLPFWRGDGPGRPIDLGRAMGELLRELEPRAPAEAEAWLVADWDLDPWAARNLVAYVQEQREAAGSLPTDRAITIERFRDELGDLRVCILTPLGARVHAPWALAIQTRLEAHYGFEIQALWSDDGIVLRLVEAEELPSMDLLLPDPEEVEELVVEQLAHSALFAGMFRENAARALLLPRKHARERQPLWAQRLKSQQLLAVAKEYPSFPIVMETYRACLRDVFDVPALVELLGTIRRREIRVDQVETAQPSPFARSLVFQYVAAFMYEGDAPLAERKAQALTLDRRLLRELLGDDDLRELLDPEVIADVEAELQGLAEGRRARSPEDVHDMLRRIGDLDEAEIAARTEGDAAAFIATLLDQRHVVRLRVAGRPSLVAVQDVATYRDGIGCPAPAGVPQSLLGPVEQPLRELVGRWARTHGPFSVRVLSRRMDVAEPRLVAELRALETAGKVVPGSFSGSDGGQWCDLEVLRRIKRRTLARLRDEIAAVDPETLGRFLPAWHGMGQTRSHAGALEEAIARLEGLPLPWSELEQVILPARVPDFSPRQLDELGAIGTLVWIGCGALGRTDGRVLLYRRDRVGRSLTAPEPPPEAALDDRHRAILAHLERRGACFFVELQSACGPTARVVEVREALWDLVWWGLVTNDTFAALRAFARPVTKVGRPTASLGAGGRWSRVADLVEAGVAPTARLHARVATLLERHGVLTREVANLEDIAGGFSTLTPVLRAMEDAGKVRRGYFIDGLGGAQYASPGAVDRLRALRTPAGDRSVQVLSAIDPANPYGWLLPWPTRKDANDGGPRRVAGATVVLVDGSPVLWLDKGDRRLVTFPAADEADRLVYAARALTGVAARRRGKMLRIERIDGTPARQSALATQLRAADFGSDVRGLTLEVR